MIDDLFFSQRALRNHCMYLVQCHPVELDRFCVLAELEVDVAHVHLQSAGVVKHSILCDDLITFSSL